MPWYLLIIPAVYALVCAVMYVGQDRLVFAPGSGAPEDSPASRGMDFEELWLTAADGARLYAWRVPADAKDEAESRRAVLFLHGNAGNLGDLVQTAANFHAFGMTSLLVDYRGYGLSEGRPSEHGFLMDARAGWDFLRAEGFAPRDITVWGYSMGGPVAAETAARLTEEGETPGMLVLESTFTSLVDMARRRYPLLPVGLLSAHRFDTVAALGRVSGPVLVIHSEEDETAPYAMGQALLAAAPEPSRLLTIRGGHNDGFQASEPAYSRGVAAFMREFYP